MHKAAEVQDHPADLINVAIEELVRQRLELPAFSALDQCRVRTLVQCAYRASASSKRSAKIFRGHIGISQNQRRLCTRRWTVCPRHGRSSGWRS